MSVYASDPFVWEKEQGRQSWARGRLVSGARSLRICLWFSPLSHLSVSKGEYVNTPQRAQPAARLGVGWGLGGCSPCFHEEARSGEVVEMCTRS